MTAGLNSDCVDRVQHDRPQRLRRMMARRKWSIGILAVVVAAVGLFHAPLLHGLAGLLDRRSADRGLRLHLHLFLGIPSRR